MKKRKKSIAIYFLIAAVLCTGSLAWFTDRAQSKTEGEAGNVCLELSNIEADLEDLAPGDRREISIGYKNLGSLSIDTRITYVLSYKIDESVASAIDNDLEKVITLSSEGNEIVLTKEQDSNQMTIASGVLNGTKENNGEDEIVKNLELHMDESVGNVGQKLIIQLDIIVEGKQERNNPEWSELHTTSINVNGQEVSVVPKSACNVLNEEHPEEHPHASYFKYYENDDGTLSVVGLNTSIVPITKVLYDEHGEDKVNYYVDLCVVDDGNVDIECVMESGLMDYLGLEKTEEKSEVALALMTTVYQDIHGLLLHDEDFVDADILDSYKDIEIPDVYKGKKVSKVGIFAFDYGQLTSVKIPNSIKEIEWSAFSSNYLTKLEIPNSVEIIKDGAFSGNRLESVTIPDSVKEIRDNAFFVNRLRSVKIPSSITVIEFGVFTGNELVSVEIPNTITEIEGVAFSDNNLKSVDIPDSVTTIGQRAFSRNRLKTAEIPDSVETIGYCAFCMNELTTIVIPDTVTKIESAAFSWNDGGNVYANEIRDDKWPDLRDFNFDSRWKLRPLSEWTSK